MAKEKLVKSMEKTVNVFIVRTYFCECDGNELCLD